MKCTVIAVPVVLIAAVCVVTLVAEAPEASPNDPSLGTWALNAQQSKLGGPAAKAFIERYDLRPDGFYVSTRSIINADGTPAFQQAVFKLDGKEYELWDNGSLANFLATQKRVSQTLSGKAVDAYTAEYTVNQDGKVITTGKRTISKDGRTMTFSAKVTTPQGRSVDVVGVFDKQ